MSQAPWYTFSRIDNFGQIDPQGNYWKPDSNILTPPGYPVTALLPGTVTAIQRTGYGQTVVTIKLDQPLNSLATHTFYEHLHDAAGLALGQHVNAGDLIGHTNYAGEGANLGFGLYSGDVYGSGSAWTTLQQDLAPGGAGLLNPTNLLNAAKYGTLNTSASSSGSGSGNGATSASIASSLNTFFEKAGLFLLAIILIGFGAYIVFTKQFKELGANMKKGAEDAAKVALL